MGAGSLSLLRPGKPHPAMTVMWTAGDRWAFGSLRVWLMWWPSYVGVGIGEWQDDASWSCGFGPVQFVARAARSYIPAKARPS